MTMVHIATKVPKAGQSMGCAAYRAGDILDDTVWYDHDYGKSLGL